MASTWPSAATAARPPRRSTRRLTPGAGCTPITPASTPPDDMRRRFRQTYSPGALTVAANSTIRGVLAVPSPPSLSYWEVEWLAAYFAFGITGGAVPVSIDSVLLYNDAGNPAAPPFPSSPGNIQPIIAAVGSSGLVAYQNGLHNLLAPLDNLWLLYQLTNTSAAAQASNLQISLQYLETTTPATPGIVVATSAG